jgi:hypothetical protein
MDNIDILIQCLGVLKRTSGTSIYRDAISRDIDELIVKITTQLSLHYGEYPSPDLEAEFRTIANEDREYMEFIETSMPLLWLLWSIYQGQIDKKN